MTRTTLAVDEQLLEDATAQARRDRTSRAQVLSAWLRRGHDATRDEALGAAYNRFYADSDPEEPPRRVRRERAARFDAAWE